MLSNHTMRSFRVESTATETKAGSDLLQNIHVDNPHCDILKILDNLRGSGHSRINTQAIGHNRQFLALPLAASIQFDSKGKI